MSDIRYGRRAVLGAALLIAAAVVAGALFWAGQPRATTDSNPSATGRVERLDIVTSAGTRTLQVEIAETPQEQALGLMFRTELADNHGMLFTHRTPRELTMWMRNTYIPLDMVFIRADGTIHRVEERTEPFSERIIASQGPAAAVLEIAGGEAERLGIKAGDTVRHRHFGTE